MPYTTEANVRDESGFLIWEDGFTGKTGTTITFAQVAYDVTSLLKNGTALTKVSGVPTSGEFSFEQANRLTLGDAAVDTDRWFLTADVGLPSATITALIARAEVMINAKLAHVFDAIPWTTAPLLIDEITRDLTICYALNSMAGRNRTIGDVQNRVQILKKHVKEILDAIVKDELVLLDETRTGDMLPQVARGGTKIFDTLVDIERLDYFDNFVEDTDVGPSPKRYN